MVKGRNFYFRIKLADDNIISMCQWAHDIWQVQALLNQRHPGYILLQVVNE